MTFSFKWFTTHLSDINLSWTFKQIDDPEKHFVILEDKIIYLPDWAKAILLACNIIVLIIAFCGNVVAIIVVLRSRLSKISTKCFLISLAVSDLILASSSMPIDLGKLLAPYHTWIFGNFMCEVVSAVQMHFFMLNAFCLFAISLERYLTIIRSFQTSKLSPTWEARIPYIILGLTWMFPFGCSVPMVFAYEQWSFWLAFKVNGTYLLDVNQTFYVCQENKNFDGITATYVSIGCIFFIILIAFVFCYISIILFVKAHRCNFKSNHPYEESSSTSRIPNNSVPTSATINTSQVRHKRTIKLIMSLILIFVICRAPNWIYLIITNVKKSPNTQASVVTTYFIRLLGSVNTSLSPFVYAIWNDSLRTTDTTKENNLCSCFSCSSKTFFNNNDNFTKIFKFKKGNMYDLTSQRKTFQSEYTQKFYLSDKTAPSLKSTASKIDESN